MTTEHIPAEVRTGKANLQVQAETVVRTITRLLKEATKLVDDSKNDPAVAGCILSATEEALKELTTVQEITSAIVKE